MMTPKRGSKYPRRRERGRRIYDESIWRTRKRGVNNNSQKRGEEYKYLEDQEKEKIMARKRRKYFHEQICSHH